MTALNSMSYRILLTIFLLILAGCDTFPRMAYSLGSAAAYTTTGKVGELCGHLEVIAKNNSLSKRESKRPETQCYFSESEMNSIVIGARILKEQLIVDIQAFNRNKEFSTLDNEVKEMLNTYYASSYLRIIE